MFEDGRQKLEEKLADAIHRSWSRWMEHLFSKCKPEETPEGRTYMVIPAETVERWQRQMTTGFEELPDEEKTSDYDEARILMSLLTGFLDEYPGVSTEDDLQKAAMLAILKAREFALADSERHSLYNHVLDTVSQLAQGNEPDDPEEDDEG